MDLDKDFQNNPFANAYFLIDGFKVHLVHEMSKNKLVKTIYVNGMIEGKWYMDKEIEETKRFAFTKQFYAHSAKYRKSVKALDKKTKNKYFTGDEDKKLEHPTFHTSVKVKTIIKAWADRDINKSIELVDSDGNVLHKYK